MNIGRGLLLLGLIYTAAVVDTTLTDAAAIGPIVPAALPLLAIVWVLLVAEPRALLAAFLAGLVCDLLTPGRIGPGAFWLLLAAAAALRVRRAWPAEHWSWPAILTALALVVWASLTGLSRWLLGEIGLPPGMILQRAVLTGLYSAAFGLPCWLLVGWLHTPSPRRSDDDPQLLIPS